VDHFSIRDEGKEQGLSGNEVLKGDASLWVVEKEKREALDPFTLKLGDADAVDA
jgi:hypothetical protein